MGTWMSWRGSLLGFRHSSVSVILPSSSLTPQETCFCGGLKGPRHCLQKARRETEGTGAHTWIEEQISGHHKIENQFCTPGAWQKPVGHPQSSSVEVKSEALAGALLCLLPVTLEQVT